MARGEYYLETPRGKLTRVGVWELGHTLGRGTYAHVRLATNTITGRKAACKILPALHAPGLDPPSDNEVTDAMEAHKELVLLKAIAGANIPGVVRLEGIIHEDGWNYIFLSLHSRSLSERGKMPEGQAVHFFAQLLRTIEALHELGISHEDLKRSNVLADEDPRDRRILRPVVVDLGFSHFNPERNLVTSYGGTFDYSSPDKIAYDPFANDVWSLGILFLKMLGIPHPYLRYGSEEDEKRAKHRIINEGPLWSWTKSQCVSTGVAGFVMGMLERDPEERSTIPELLNHVYIKRRLKNIPPKILLPPDRLSIKVSRPVPESVFDDLLFLAYQAGEFRLCESPKNFKRRLYGRERGWPQRYANMLSRYAHMADVEWEDVPLLSVAQRNITARRNRPMPALKAINLSPLPPKSILGPSNKANVPPEEDYEELPHKANYAALKAPRTPLSQVRTTTRLLTPVPVKRPKTFGFGRGRAPQIPFPKIGLSSVSHGVDDEEEDPTPTHPPSRIPLHVKKTQGINPTAMNATNATKAAKDIRRKMRINSSADLGLAATGYRY